MKIRKLRLKNFRCFKDFSIDFNTGDETHGGLTIIVAKNGNGKTTVLSGIRIAFGTFTSAFDYPSVRHIDKTDSHIETPGNSIQSILTFPVAVDAEGEIEKMNVQWHRELFKEGGRTTVKDAKAVTDYGIRLKNALKNNVSSNVVLPIVAFYGTGRLWQDHKDTDHDRPLLRTRDYGYDYALGEASNYGAMCKWLTSAIQEELSEKIYSITKDEVLTSQLDAIRGALTILLQEEGYHPMLHINQKYKTLAILAPDILNKEYAPTYWSLPVSFLSDGVRCAFSLVADIAFRCAKLNPALGTKACEDTPGIVLIDEIELHLHPAWQQHILPTLQKIFPKIQFVVTTHSPQVISSVPAECVRIIDGGNVYRAVGTEGADSIRILKRIFGTEAYPPDNPIRKKLEEYSKLVYKNQWKSTDAQKLREELDRVYQGEEPLLTELDLHIENEEWEAKNPGDDDMQCNSQQKEIESSIKED